MAGPGEPPPNQPPPPEQAGEKRSRRERARIAAMVVLAVLITLFAVLNGKQVKVNWIAGSGKAPLIIVIVISLLAGKLSSGQSLAEIAAATPGRSVAGLIEALVTAKRAALAAIAAKLPQRVRAEVERPGGPRRAAALARARGASHVARHHARVPPAHRLIATPGFRAAASYLGMSAVQLQSELESGRTLAAIASATSV